MAGGTWIPGVEKVRPGLYMNFKIKALERIKSAERGTVTMPLLLSWGEPKKFLTIEKDSDVMEKLGYDINDSQMLLVREAKKRAKTLLIYRLNDGVKATATFGTGTVTAKYSGLRGNDLLITAEKDPSKEGMKRVKTFLNGRVVNQQIAEKIEELKANDWVTFAGTGAIAETAGVKLTGGTDGNPANQDHTDYLAAAEIQHFDVIAYPHDNASLRTSFVTFVKRLREEEGKKIQGVLSGEPADYEGIINVKNGVKLNDVTLVSAIQAVAWVAGATAGASIADSNTYSVYEGAIDANPRMRNSEIVEALKKGEWVFVHDGDKVKVEKDINSLVTYTQERNGRFSKNRVIRVLDAIANDFYRVAHESYIGKVDNNQDGQALLKEAANQYLRDLQDAGAITNVDFVKDFFIDPDKSRGDEVYATLGVQPVDSMEKFFFTVEVR